MAVTSQTLEQGPRNVVMRFTNDGDAESAVVKVDVSALSPACERVSILKCEYSTNNRGGATPTGVAILWDATTPELAIALPPNNSDCLDYSEMGGLQNTKATGWTGDIKFTCGADDAYTITLWMRKKSAS